MSHPTPQLVLASASPRRYQLLGQIDIVPQRVIATSIDETPKQRERPRIYVERMAQMKAEAAFNTLKKEQDSQNFIILAADTVVALGSRMLHKTDSVEEAEDYLRRLSGCSHRVYTSVVVMLPNGKQFFRLAEARLRFKRLAPQEIQAYLASNEWRDKAGGYAIQGRAGAFATKIVGSYSAIVGLPLFETASLLEGNGLLPRQFWSKAEALS